MNIEKEAKEIIRTLNNKGFYAECPHCCEKVHLKDAGLFYLDNFTREAEEIYNNKVEDLKERKKALKKKKEKIVASSEIGARSTNIGFMLERLAPTMKGFGFDRADCRSLFDPIDYVVFEGLSEKRKVSKIIFIEIKTGGAVLTPKQLAIKDLVDKKKVEFDVYKIKQVK